jgi:hypothetical protein
MIHILSNQEYNEQQARIKVLEETTEKQEAKQDELLKHINKLEHYITEQQTNPTPHPRSKNIVGIIAIIIVSIVFIYISINKNKSIQENG